MPKFCFHLLFSLLVVLNFNSYYYPPTALCLVFLLYSAYHWNNLLNNLIHTYFALSFHRKNTATVMPDCNGSKRNRQPVERRITRRGPAFTCPVYSESITQPVRFCSSERVFAYISMPGIGRGRTRSIDQSHGAHLLPYSRIIAVPDARGTPT